MNKRCRSRGIDGMDLMEGLLREDANRRTNNRDERRASHAVPPNWRSLVPKSVPE